MGGWWGMYKVKELFELDDNCGGPCTHASWSCNATDSGGFTSKGDYLEECFIDDFGNELRLYVQIEAVRIQVERIISMCMELMDAKMKLFSEEIFLFLSINSCTNIDNHVMQDQLFT